jgi:hypothetical protein
MVIVRPYRKGVGRDAALPELRRCAGSHFDAAAAEPFYIMMAMSAEADAPAD